jgi:formylmethanofuran dehydrogenase subunit E
VRTRAGAYAPGLKTRYYTQLHGYQSMPVDELFCIQPVALQPPLADLISRADLRVTCSRCGEEIINGRQLHVDGGVLCRCCAGERYYLIQA